MRHATPPSLGSPPSRTRKANGQSRTPSPHGLGIRLLDSSATAPAPSPRSKRWPTVASIAAGLWLVASAFAWPHGDASRTNSWFVGLLIVAGGAWGLREPVGRLLNTLLASWLVFSTLAISPRSELTFWHNLALGVLVLVLSLLPSSSSRARTT